MVSESNVKSKKVLSLFLSVVLAFSLCGAFSGKAYAASAPAKTNIVSIAKAKKSFTVKWKKSSSSSVTGYEIRYSKDKKMSVGVKKVKAAKSATAKKISSGIKAATTYYMQIRVAYKSGGKTKYTGWSSKKSATTLVGSGNSSLDNKIESILSKKIKKTGEAGLKKAFNYVSDLGYRAYSTPSKSTSWKKWTVKYAKDMADKQKGNCYQAAALLTWLAKGLGYDARAVCGTYTGGSGKSNPHGWTEVTIGGKVYIFDANNQNTANKAHLPISYYKISKDSETGLKYAE